MDAIIDALGAYLGPTGQLAGGIHLGCAGWSLRRETAAAFPAEGTHLARYGAVFDCVEINSSFYRPHQPQTYARWAQSVPEGFRFAVKLPRSITHERALDDADALIEHFAAEARALGDKLGYVLVQLPPSLRLDVETARKCFQTLRLRLACKIACEARHASWFGEAADRLLSEQGIARVVADPLATSASRPHRPTADSLYLRLHGSPQTYYSAYPRSLLAALADTLAACAASGRDCWCIFDNTAAGAALADALYLRERLAARGGASFAP